MSNINVGNIDATYPIAGQDNDSQGFRDNFAAIKTALNTASIEITALELNSANLTGTNVFYNIDAPNDPLTTGVIEGALFRNNKGQVQGSHSDANVTSPKAIYVGSGEYQIFNINTNTVFQLHDWASGGVDTWYRNIRVEVLPNTSTSNYNRMTMNFTDYAGGVIHRDPSVALPYTATWINISHIWDIWTTDGGANTFVKFAGTYTGAWTNVTS